MKTKIITLSATFLLATIALSHAGEPAQPKPASAEFERMKSLVGTWKGTTDMDQGPVEMVSQYRLIAGGSVLEEKVFAGTPNEMTTMYYDKKGRLALTHYCMMGNRPGMVLKSADAKTMRFAFDETCGIFTTPSAARSRRSSDDSRRLSPASAKPKPWPHCPPNAS